MGTKGWTGETVTEIEIGIFAGKKGRGDLLVHLGKGFCFTLKPREHFHVKMDAL